MSAALLPPRRTHFIDQSCVQHLTVLVTDEDRDVCCSQDNMPLCCQLSRNMSRLEIIRQLRRVHTELAVVVDQDLYDRPAGPRRNRLFGVATTPVGYLKNSCERV